MMFCLLYKTPCVNSPPLSPALLCVLSQVSLPFDLSGLQYQSRAALYACVCLNYSHGSCIKAERVETGVTLLFSRDTEAVCIDQWWVRHKSVNLSPIPSPVSRCTLSFHFPHLSPLSLSLSVCESVRFT